MSNSTANKYGAGMNGGLGLLSLIFTTATIGLILALVILNINKTVPGQEEGDTIFDSIEEAKDVADILEANQREIQNNI